VSAIPRPTDVLPHRPPFLFVDEVTSLDPGTSATGYWRLTGAEPFFAGHFPGRPTLPGVLMCESLAQLAGIVIKASGLYPGKLGLFGGLDAARFRRQVVPGDKLELSITLSRMSARGGKATGVASVNGKTACECEMMFVLVDE
jgi:3-hydroxyacyl-[acyl-carrier-protein] dehydratase